MNFDFSKLSTKDEAILKSMIEEYTTLSEEEASMRIIDDQYEDLTVSIQFDSCQEFYNTHSKD